LEKDGSIIKKHIHKDHLDSDWTTIAFKLADNKIQGGLVGAIDDSNQFIIAGNFSLSNWVELVSSNTIFIGIVYYNLIVLIKCSIYFELSEGKSRFYSVIVFLHF